MPNNLSAVPELSKAIITKEGDVIVSGHGSYSGVGETTVPPGVELWVMGPPGSCITDALGGALEKGVKIKKLAIKSKKTGEFIAVEPIVYKAGSKAPDYELHSPRGLHLQPGKPHVIGTEGAVRLSALWARIVPLANKSGTTRVFWAACAAMTGASNQVVVHE